MQLIIENNLLQESLNIVTRALPARPAKDVLKGVSLSASDNLLTLVCTDGNMTIETSVPCTVDEPGQAVIDGKILADMVRKLSGGAVYLNVNDRQVAAIRCNGFRSSITGMNPIDFPDTPAVHTQTKIHMQAKEFRDMINHVAFSIASDESRKILTGCLLEILPFEIRMVALDGFRMAIERISGTFDIGEEQNSVRCVIPGRVITELGKILPDSEDPCCITLDKNRMEVRMDQTVFITQQLLGEYIDYNRILPTQYSTKVKINRTDLATAISQTSIMATVGKNNLIRMTFDENGLDASSAADLGSTNVSIPADVQGNPVNIAFNAKYVDDVIRNITDEELIMSFNSSVSPCIITPVEGDKFLYLILPIRVFQ